MPNRISLVTRRNVFDEIRLRGIIWAGRLNEPDFLARLFDLSEIRSTDHRYSNVAGDIFQHRIRNYDWDDYWVFDDSRFNLLHCEDEIFCRFLCEMIHPAVRSNGEEIAELVEIFDRHLQADDFRITEHGNISGHPIFHVIEGGQTATSGITDFEEVSSALNSEYVSRQIQRMRASVDNDPELAIGTAKEYVETICKGILADRNFVLTGNETVPQLVHRTCDTLGITGRGGVQDQQHRALIRQLVGSLSNVVNCLAALRNQYGTGHGHHPDTRSLERAYARLAVGTASAVGNFLYHAHKERE